MKTCLQLIFFGFLFIISPAYADTSILPLKSPEITFSTSSFQFQSMREEHLPALINLFSQKIVMEKLYTGSVIENDEAVAKGRRQIQRWVNLDPRGSFAVFAKGDNAPLLGFLLVSSSSSSPDEIEIGYLLFPEHWGKGLGYAIPKAYIEEYIPALNSAYPTARINRLVATAEPTNVASVRILDKLGFLADEGIALTMQEVSSEILSQELDEDSFYIFEDESKILRVLGRKYNARRYFFAKSLK